MGGHGAAGNGTHFSAVGTIKRKEGFAGETFAEAKEAGVFGQGASAGKDTEAEGVFETFLNLGRRDLGGGVGGPVEIHKMRESPF